MMLTLKLLKMKDSTLFMIVPTNSGVVALQKTNYILTRKNNAISEKNVSISTYNEALTYAFIGLSLVAVLAAGYYVYTVINEERQKEKRASYI